MNSVTLFQMLGEIDRWGIDIFRIGDLSNNRPLTAVAYAAFQVRKCFKHQITV
jgi:cAMP-specific phosphodiesterase 4